MENKIPAHPIISSAFYKALSKNERLVFDVIRDMKYANNAQKIADQAGISRSNAILILKRFTEWKLVAKVHWKNRIHWIYNRRLRYLQKNDGVLA